VIKGVFKDCYTVHFCPTAQRYCDENKYPRRELMLFDSTPGHPENTGKIWKTVMKQV
jgi:hypothetical protein